MMPIQSQRAQWPHRVASLRVAETEPYSEPVGHRTPRWNISDRPELPDGTRYFSPTEVNPHPDTWARPDLGPRQYDISPDPALALKNPGVKQHNSDFDTHQAVDRRPNTLYRGFSLDFDDPYNRSEPFDRIRRLLRGDQYENTSKSGVPTPWGSNGDEMYLRQPGRSEDGRWGPDVMPSDAEAAAAPHPLGYDHPELPHLLLQHLLDSDWSGDNINPDSLGTHWTTDLGMAAQFAGLFPRMTKGIDRRLSAVLEGHWRGQGEDPYRRQTGGNFDEENEITLLPGAPLGIHRVHLFNPQTMQWHTHNTGGVQHHARRTALSLEDDTAIGDYAPGPIKVPETKSLPRYYDPDQGEYLPKFSPTGVNPRPDTSARPQIQWKETGPPQDTLPLGVDAYKDIGDGEAVPVDRRPTTLYRGVKVDMYHPDLAGLRRALFGGDKEWYLNAEGNPDNSSYDEYDWDGLLPHSSHEPSLFDGDPAATDQALASGPLLNNPFGTRQPLAQHLAHGVLDHLQRHADEHDLGTHWTLSPEQASEFANYYEPHEIPIRLSADWRGEGEDPYRRHTNGHWHDEQEITLLPGAPVNVHTVEVMHPDTGDWYPIRLHTPSPRHANLNR